MMTSRRLRPRATRPTPLHWLSRTAVTALLLATVAVHASTQVQPGPYDSPAFAHDPDLNDILESAVGPPVPAPPDGYELLLERARRQVRLEQRAEDESRRREKRKNRRGDQAGDDLEKTADSSGAASPEPESGMRVVRETFYIPRSQFEETRHREEHSSSIAPSASDAVSAGASAPEPPPADFRQTVGKLRILRPLFTYAIQHPLHFLISYLIVPTLSLIWFLLVEFMSWILLLVYPVTYLVSTLVLAPLHAFSSVISALAPVLYALGGALAIGAGIGALGGLVAAQSTRTVIDATLDQTQKTLKWLGILAKPEGSLDADQRYEATMARESYAGLSREAEQLAEEAIAEAEAEDANDHQPKNEEEEKEGEGFAATAVQKDDDGEWRRAHAAAEARANRIEALRYRVKVEGAGSSPPTGTSMLVA